MKQISSRSGRFKKINPLVDLKVEAKFLSPIFKNLKNLHQNGQLSCFELLALVIIHHQNYRLPKTWLGPRRNTPLINHSYHSQIINTSPLPNFDQKIFEKLKNLKCLEDVFNNFQLKSIPQPALISLLNLSLGLYPLKILFHIPLPYELLEIQVKGHRCVTILVEESFLSKPVLGERDHLSFVIHDLIHAHHFYQSEDLKLGQLSLYQFFYQAMKTPKLLALNQNPQFQAEFHYYISDMNAYFIHILKCFKAACEKFGNKFSFYQILKQMNFKEEEMKPLIKLNSPEHHPSVDDPEIFNLFYRRFSVGV